MKQWRYTVFYVRGHYTTLKRIFSEPPPEISWEHVENLIIACDAKVRHTPGDGTEFQRQNISEKDIFKPTNGTPQGTLRKTRKFLRAIGVKEPRYIWQYLATI